MRGDRWKLPGWLYGWTVGVLVAVNVIPMACEYFSIMRGFKSYFVDFHLLDGQGRAHAGFLGLGTIPVADGEIFQYGYQTADEKRLEANRRRVKRDEPDAHGFHWADRGYVWSDYLQFLPARTTVVEGQRLGLTIEPWQMSEVSGPGAAWDVKGPHMSFLGRFPDYRIELENEYFQFDLNYRPRAAGWHLSNGGRLIPAGDFGQGHMNELPCNVTGAITHKKSHETFTVSGWGFLEDANGTWNWFEWGGHHYFTCNFPNGWAVSFWLAQGDWQWGWEDGPAEIWVWDADRREYYNGYDIEVSELQWDREQINGMDFAQGYRVRALTQAGVVELAARSVTFKPILGGVKFVPWDVKMAYSKAAMSGTFTYLDGSPVELTGGVGVLENFQRFMPNLIYITPGSLVLLILLVGGRRIAANRHDRSRVRRMIGLMAAALGAVLLLTVIWMR